jgi:hypothetical protein
MIGRNDIRVFPLIMEPSECDGKGFKVPSILYDMIWMVGPLTARYCGHIN